MSIKELQKSVDTWIKATDKGYFSELTNTAVLMEEVGELARYMSRVYGEQSFKSSCKPLDIKAELADEMADILWVLTCLANQCHIDLEKAIELNFEKKNQRDKNRHSSS